MSEREETIKSESHVVNLLLLHWTAGILDGLSYLRAHVFTANMTGNVVLLGIDVMQHKTHDAVKVLVAVLAFCLGALLAGLLILRTEDEGRNAMKRGFAAELVLLLIFAPLYLLHVKPGAALIEGGVIFVGAMALAVQSVAVRRLRIAGVASTFISGTITTSMVAVARLIRNQTPPEKNYEEKHAALLVGMLGVYFIGVVFATLLSSRAPWLVAVLPAMILAIVFWRARV